jgi:glycosyltransferase involved in cell wall biosynthesis
MTRRARRLLLLQAQSPFDPSSGAAQSMRSIANLLVKAGWEAHCIASSATESGRACPVAGAAQGDHLFTCTRDGVTYELAPIPPAQSQHWVTHAGVAMSAALDRCIGTWQPDLVLTFGGTDIEARWRTALRTAGIPLVFALHNAAYLHPEAPPSARAVLGETLHFLAPSAFLAACYRQAAGIDVAVELPPIAWTSVRAATRDPVFTTFVNPEPAKGLMFVVRLLDELARKRPDLPLLVVESRGKAEHLFTAARRGGMDLGRYDNLYIAPPFDEPAGVFAMTRVLLMPSVWEEPAGRLALEALVNGAVPLVSPRGGLPEMLLDTLAPAPLPDTLTMDTREPVTAEAVQPWRERVEQLYDDETFYQVLSARGAARAGEVLDETRQVERYAARFERWLNA